MKHLSPDDQNVFLMALRHRAEYWRRMKRVRALSRVSKHALLIAACAAGLFTGTTVVRAADVSAVSAPALFNEANTAQRDGELGSAILGYERAQWLAPGDKAITQNLRAAREKAGVAAPVVPTWQRPTQWLNFNSLTALASISLLLFGLLFFGTRWIPVTLRGLARCTATSLGVSALLAAAAVGLRWPELNRAVVIGSQPAAHIAPAQSANVSFALKPGELVRRGKTYGEFVFIRTADGRSGWMPGTAVERIIPPTS